MESTTSPGIEYFKRLLLERSRAGLMLKRLRLKKQERREWLARHAHLPPEELVPAVRKEFGKVK